MPDNTEEPVVCPSCEGENPENHQPLAASGLREGDVTEIGLDLIAAPARENQTSDDATPLTQAERDVDQVIGVLLGEPQETTQEATEPTEEEQVAAQVQEPPAQAQGQEAAPQPELVPTVESVLEAILFATDEPLTDNKLAGIVETTAKQVRESIESLNAKYLAENHAFRIEQIAGGYQMLTLNTYNSWLKKMLRARSDNKLSPAAMETLAIIAYKQPIIRADIEAIRGVAVGEVIRSLMYKGLVKITGRAEILGRPMLYGTTKKFLEIFGLNSLKDLPKAEELKNPDR
ncbi:MAG: SMC-Scp complex subunit ScpB [Phycisphaerae bacterium]|nr:SMC-Scp complex subunit ScpB [Phycisphaerae bacterium]